MSQTKVKSGLLNFPDQTDFVKLPSGTTAQRPSSPEEGYSRYNTTDDKLEYWNGTVWQQLPALDPPTLTSVDYPGNDLAADPAGGQTILINGTNFVSGISVEIGSTEVSSVTLNSTTQLAITSPALTAGDYDVTVTNLDASTITASDFISYNGVPSWVTASGSLGSLSFEEAISTISLSATEPDGGSISYAVTSGALPTGLALSSSGDITGTMPSGSAETTYSFTVTATDDENQSTNRSFSITGVVPLVPSQNFNTVTYTGNNITNPITGVGFEPDLVWVKNRGLSVDHFLTNSVSGAGAYLVSNSTDAEDTTARFNSFDSDGFTVSTDTTLLNNSSYNYVAWCWKAGGTPVSNTDGSITSQVSANTEAGFSVVSYTGNGANGTVGHGLGTTPNIVLSKRRTGGTSAWSFNGNVGGLIYGSNKLTLETTNAIVSDTNEILAANSNNFTAGTSTAAGASGSTYIAYCFAEVEGFSKFSSYVGTGTSNGNFVVTGFEPAFVMVKRTDASGGSWLMVDNKRIGTGNEKHELFANTSTAESGGGYDVAFLENGFQMQTTTSNANASGATYIYMAFAADLNTQVPTKADSFKTVNYSGRSSVGTVDVQTGFQPDFVWIKCKGTAHHHYIVDSIRGANKVLSSSSDASDPAFTPDEFTSFNSNGFTVNFASGGGRTAYSNDGPYVSWNWKAGVIPYINTNGSVDSIVTANQASGFSIVKHVTPAAGGNYTIGHGLSQAPEFIITKNLDSNGYRWTTYDVTSGPGYYMALNEGRAATSFANAFPVTPDASVFTLSQTWPHPVGDSSISYCFHSVSGFSKIGEYTGNGSSNGPSITTGFNPAFIMVKCTSSPDYDWLMTDNTRGGILYADLTNAEYSPAGNAFDDRMTANPTGFQITTTNGNWNENGQTYLYIAFAEQP